MVLGWMGGGWNGRRGRRSPAGEAAAGDGSWPAVGWEAGGNEGQRERESEMEGRRWRRLGGGVGWVSGEKDGQGRGEGVGRKGGFPRRAQRMVSYPVITSIPQASLRTFES
jgi:hypothetical protein